MSASNQNPATVVFPVRLGQDDWESDARAWRCEALDLPGASVREIYVDGKRIDRDYYKIIAGQAKIRWILTNKQPSQAIVFIEVITETKEQLLADKVRAEKSEANWKKIGILVPVVTAIIAAISAFLIPKSLPIPDSVIAKNLRIEAFPRDFSKKIPAPTITINSSPATIPYFAAFNTDINAMIDFSDVIQVNDSLLSKDRRRREYLARLVQDLENIDGPLNQAASSIINSCSGGSSGVTPGNGARTIGIINGVRGTANQIKSEASTLLRDGAP